MNENNVRKKMSYRSRPRKYKIPPFPKGERLYENKVKAARHNGVMTM